MKLGLLTFAGLFAACQSEGIPRTLLQGGSGGGGGGGGGQVVELANCTGGCGLSSCESDSDCGQYWEDNMDKMYGGVDQFLTDAAFYCNDTNITVDCDSSELDSFLTCLGESSCWDSNVDTYAPGCTFFSEFDAQVTVYDETGTVSTTTICNTDWDTISSDIFGDIASVRVTTDCSSGDSGDSGDSGESSGESGGSGGESGGSGGEGGGGSGRRILQESGGSGGESGGSGGEGSSSSSGGEGSSSSSGGESGGESGGGSSCGEAVLTISVNYLESYVGTDYDLGDVISSMMADLISESGLDVSVSVDCYAESNCCDEDCGDYSDGDYDNGCDSATYTCEGDDSGESDGANTMMVAGLIAYATIFYALFAN